MYATLKNDRPRAKLLYSEFCTYAPLVRQYDRNVVRPQMARIHAPHLKSGYLAAIDFQDTVDGEGRPDWAMLYTPGPKARAEYRAFARRGGPTVLEVEPLPLMADPSPRLAAPGPSPLEAELIDRGITPAMAGDLVRVHGEEKIRAQVEHLDWLTETKPGKVADPAAWLVAAIRNGHAAPKGFVSRAERQRREEARQAQEREKAEQRRRQREQEARDRAIREEVDAYLKRLTPAERKALEAEVLARAGAERGRATRRPRPGSAPSCCWACCGSTWPRSWGGESIPAGGGGLPLVWDGPSTSCDLQAIFSGQRTQTASRRGGRRSSRPGSQSLLPRSAASPPRRRACRVPDDVSMASGEARLVPPPHLRLPGSFRPS